MSEAIIAMLKQPWFWTLFIGLALGIYVGYHAGLVTGYERALEALQNVTKVPPALLQAPP